MDDMFRPRYAIDSHDAEILTGQDQRTLITRIKLPVILTVYKESEGRYILEAKVEFGCGSSFASEGKITHEVKDLDMLRECTLTGGYPVWEVKE